MVLSNGTTLRMRLREICPRIYSIKTRNRENYFRRLLICYFPLWFNDIYFKFNEMEMMKPNIERYEPYLEITEAIQDHVEIGNNHIWMKDNNDASVQHTLDDPNLLEPNKRVNVDDYYHTKIDMSLSN